MAELSPLDEKLGEVIGLAQAAQVVVRQVRGMESADTFASDLERLEREAADTEQRTDALVDGLEGRKTAIREKARETKGEATEMAKTYLGDEEEALDGFEFLSMSEAGELCHWEIVERIASRTGEDDVARLAGSILPVQRAHIDAVRKAYLALADEEAAEA